VYYFKLEVLGFLFGMFSIVTALDRAGVLKLIAMRMLARAKDVSSLLLIFVLGMGILSAFLVNDTIALLGIPLIIYISKHIGIRPVVLLISLAFSISVGSTMTPIGNPQNLLIAIQSGISLPFTTFIIHLTIPTLINLFLTYMILRIYFRNDLSAVDTARTYQDKRLAMANAANPVDEKNVSISLIKNSHLAKTSSVILFVEQVSLALCAFRLEFLEKKRLASHGRETRWPKRIRNIAMRQETRP
jgi:Na+/H+ antiporter NhaD/arsenite permease-like protein